MAKTRGGRKTAPSRRSQRLLSTRADEVDETNRAEPSEIEADHQPKQKKKKKMTLSDSNRPDSSEIEVAHEHNRKKKKRSVDEDIEEDREPVSGDDCEVASDEDCNEVEYANKSHDAVTEEGVDLEEANCEEAFEAEFREEAREEGNKGDVIDDDSGDEIWNDERIPDPLSHSDDEDVPEEEEENRGTNQAGTGEELWLGKAFDGPEEFKSAVLRYSLKTKYDIKLY